MRAPHFQQVSFKRSRVKAVSPVSVLMLLWIILPCAAWAVPANDNLANAIAVTAFPYTESVDNTGAALEGNESNYGNYSFWYTITPDADAALTVTAMGDAADPIVGLYTGNAFPLAWADGDGDAQSNLDNLGGKSEYFVWGLTAGITYRIRIASFTQGAIDLTINVHPITALTNDDMADAKPVGKGVDEFVNLANATLEAGEPGCVSIDKSMWYTVTPATDSMLMVIEDGEHGDHGMGLYEGPLSALNPVVCFDSDNRGSDSEGYVRMLTGGVTYYIVVGARSEEAGVLRVRIAVMPLEDFTNNDLADAKGVAGDPFAMAVDNTGAGQAEGDEVMCQGSDFSAWCAVTPAQTGMVDIIVAAPDNVINPALGVYTGQGHPLTEVYCQNLNNLFSSDQERYGGGEIAQVPMTGGATYYIRVGTAAEGKVGLYVSGQGGNPAVISDNAAISNVSVVATPAGKPAGFKPHKAMEYTANGVVGTANVSITFESLPGNPRIYKVTNTGWLQIYPANKTTGITDVALNGTTLTFAIADNSDCDLDNTVGVIKDPIVVGGAAADEVANPALDDDDGNCFIGALKGNL